MDPSQDQGHPTLRKQLLPTGINLNISTINPDPDPDPDPDPQPQIQPLHHTLPTKSKYGIPPRMHHLFGHQDRKYFDSGDFAISKSTSTSTTTTTTATTTATAALPSQTQPPSETQTPSHPPRKTSDAGTFQTGTDHPLRSGISRPFAPVPIDCNVDGDANKPCQGQMGGILGKPFESVKSPLAEGGEEGCLGGAEVEMEMGGE
ncbi:hypothetical protein BJX70DRAFT_368076 [Aspergillus crustosus]